MLDAQEKNRGIIMKYIILILLFVIYASVSFGQIVVTVDTDKDEYELGELVEIYITAHNTTSDSITLYFGSSCQSEYYIDYFYSGSYHGCYAVITQVTIMPDSSFTWTWVHTDEYYQLGEGVHSIVGEVIDYGISDTILIMVFSFNIDDSNPIPSEFALEQNFPNPFNPKTIIKFSIPNNGLVKMGVYDIMGREVEILINKKMMAGRYSIIWNGNNVPSGVYLIRIESDNFKQTKKALLLK